MTCRLAFVVGLDVALACMPPHSVRAADSFSKLHEFTGTPDAASPLGRIVRDHAGNVFGTSYGGGLYGEGSVFEVSPPQAGSSIWSEAVIFSFTGGSEGASPDGLVRASNGTLYGVATLQGENSHCGTVFELRHAAMGWKHRTLWQFKGARHGDACIPRNAPAIGANGVLYGGTQAGGSNNKGAVYALTPPVPGSTAWTESVVWSFGGPNEGLGPETVLLDGSGALYGTTGDDDNTGEVWRLTPPAGGVGEWTKTVLWQPSIDDCEEPYGPGAIDPQGVLYGTCVGTGGQINGSVYTLTPPGPGQTVWTPALIWSTGVPGEYLSGGPVLGRYGHLTVATEGQSVSQVLRLLPPAAGGTAWQGKVLWSFSQSDGSDLSVPFDGPDNEVFGLAAATATAQGDVWMLTPP